ncbi:8020_t:CDS:2 [Paraglomus brasilianum]|uniref:8020_t:CDS:1 n=1 Tax=Paraglomus brasilianum TaxID=144538 RepID=A0A9N9GZR4_9GLOM|nr:8020_t:CDS:2 [Paraglomus brasilianum]
MIAINFNTISDYHWDEHDDPNSLCCLVALGDFDGGELCFPQLQIVIPLRPGQVVAFSSRLLLHGNFPVTRGIRHSVVYFVHSMFFHHLRNFTEIYKDRKDGIERDVNGSAVPTVSHQDLNNANGLNRIINLDRPKANQIRVPPSSTDCRRGCIDLSRARRGLKAEDPLSDSE